MRLISVSDPRLADLRDAVKEQSKHLDQCTVCGRPQMAHEHMAHMFSPPWAPIGLRTAERPASPPPSGGDTGVSSNDQVESPEANVRIDQGRSGISLTGDPVLRMILIRQGLITPQDLTEVENELLSLGMVTNEKAMGQPRDR